jgi:hypothetical protein
MKASQTFSADAFIEIFALAIKLSDDIIIGLILKSSDNIKHAALLFVQPYGKYKTKPRPFGHGSANVYMKCQLLVLADG